MVAIPGAIASYVEGLKQHHVATVAATVADDLRFVTTRKVMNKPEFLAFLTALYTGFPDWHYDHDPIETHADGTIAIKWRQGGTHTATLALPGFPTVPPTGRKVVIPPHYFFYYTNWRGRKSSRSGPTRSRAARRAAFSSRSG